MPADVVPVIDMLAEHDDVRVRDGLLALELCEQSVGRRAAGAAFRGEELDQTRRAGLAAVCAWATAANDKREQEEKRERSELLIQREAARVCQHGCNPFLLSGWNAARVRDSVQRRVSRETMM